MVVNDVKHEIINPRSSLGPQKQKGFGSRFVRLYLCQSVCECPILISRKTALLVKIKVLTFNNREYLYKINV